MRSMPSLPERDTVTNGCRADGVSLGNAADPTADM